MDGEKKFSTWETARSIPSLSDFAMVLDDYLNAGGKQFKDGLVVGRELRAIHRTLQRQVVAFCLGIVSGISEQQYTDLRNEMAIDAAKKVKEMLDTGQLDPGPYLQGSDNEYERREVREVGYNKGRRC